MINQKQTTICILFFFTIKFSLISCQSISLNADTPASRRQLSPQIPQVMSLQFLSLSLDIQVDEQGNGFMFNSNLEKTEILTLHNYQAISLSQNQILQGIQPQILWKKTGKGEIIYKEAINSPHIGTFLPSDADQRPLKRLTNEFDGNILNNKTNIIDYQRKGLDFLSQTPIVNSEGNGFLSGVLTGRKLREKNLFKYPLAYIPIQSHHYNNSLIELSEFVLAEEHPLVWFNQTQGIALFKSTEAEWILQEIHNQKLNSSQKSLGTSLIYPLAQLDNKGKGWILTRTTQSELKLHLIQDFKLMDTKSLGINIPQGHSFSFAFSDGQGFLLSYAPTQTSSELYLFLIKDNQVQPLRSVILPLNQASIYTIDHAIQTQGQQQGRGVLAVGTTQQTKDTGKIYLFPIVTYIEQPSEGASW
ncbi:MAG: hypothetical protein AB7I41_25415 [Candidatus Sericytochromatia bacterium]